jgi:heptosyltransferase-2
MIRSILIIKIGAIGDIVMSLPMLSLLREKYPSATITWVCGKTVAPLIEATSLVNRIITIDEKKLFQSGLKNRLLTLAKLWKALFFQSFDLAITAHPDPRYRLLSLFCRKKLHRFFNRKQKRPFPISGRYHLHEHIRLADPFEGPTAPVPPFPPLHTPSSAVVEGFLSPSLPNVVIAPGGAKNALSDSPLRRWPPSHYAEVLKQLSSHPLNLIVLGAPSDKWVEPYFSGISYQNAIGKLSLLECIALLKKTAVFITHDSGPLHLAKLAGCPTIALFGPTNPYEFHNQSENIHVFWEGGKLPCAPCYDGKGYAQCAQNLCLQRIRPETVIKKALGLLCINHSKKGIVYEIQ